MVVMIDTSGQTSAVESASSDGTLTTISPENLPSLPLPQLPSYAELVYLEESKKGHFWENQRFLNIQLYILQYMICHSVIGSYNLSQAEETLIAIYQYLSDISAENMS